MRMSRRMVLYNTFRKILYHAGTDNTAVTGGLTAYAYVPSTSSLSTAKPTVTNNSDSITLKSAAATNGVGGSYFTANAIDITLFRALKINISSIAVNGGYINVGVTPTKANKFERTAHANVTETGTISVDVSSLSGDYYIFINLRGANAQTMTFTKWWLE